MFEVDEFGQLIKPNVGALTYITKKYVKFDNGREPSIQDMFDYKVRVAERHLDSDELECYKQIIEYQKYVRDDSFKVMGKFDKIKVINVRLYTDFLVKVFDKKTYNLILKKSRDINKFLKCNVQSIKINKEKKERQIRMFFEVQELNPKHIGTFIKFLRKTSNLLLTKQ